MLAFSRAPISFVYTGQLGPLAPLQEGARANPGAVWGLSHWLPSQGPPSSLLGPLPGTSTSSWAQARLAYRGAEPACTWRLTRRLGSRRLADLGPLWARVPGHWEGVLLHPLQGPARPGAAVWILSADPPQHHVEVTAHSTPTAPVC